MLNPVTQLIPPHTKIDICRGCAGKLIQLQDVEHIKIPLDAQYHHRQFYTLHRPTSLFVCEECRLVYYLPELLPKPTT